jgi:hypothetical protein
MMTSRLAIPVVLIAVVSLSAQQSPPQGRGRSPRGAEPLVTDDQAGYHPIFDGKSLNGWDGDPAFWKAVDGALVGESTASNTVKENTFLIWRGGEPQDFELKVQFRMNATNIGIQICSVHLPAGTKVGNNAVQGRSGDAGRRHARA